MTQPPKILVVDDDPEFLDSTRIMLEGKGYRVAVAPGEDEALAEIETETPDLLILDVMMAKWDSGFRLLWKLKVDDHHKGIPVLMVTAVDTEVGVNFAQHVNTPHRTADDKAYLPVDAYIVKPVTTADLLRTVEGILGHAEKQTASTR